ncbi:hypothetical protein GOBAR_AA32869 [Gossypium barbadense]|uniref:BAR domain-containing protein n=1 Tax=Gossypium barbadense TaxID=3634 RepID=A0A2P5W9X1_GOSBA|nr:hypothetical protein GOBAR_AA32869 [Gossypium barbadense]
MQDMRDCYDSLLSAAAAAANSAFEFSESLQEMGDCLGKIAVNDDEESKVLSMLGKVQLGLQKLVDSYVSLSSSLRSGGGRSHIIQTITSPSESLLNELRTVEEMKRQCDEKRNVYEYMAMRHKEKGRSKSGKGENFSVQHLQVAHDKYQEEATLLFFRLKSLKQGQSRSLLTQAARHHAAQLDQLAPQSSKASLNEQSNNSWHSSPFEHKKHEMILGDEKFCGSAIINAQSFLRESNSPASSTRLPPRVSPTAAYSKKIKRQSFSGPLTSKPWPTKTVSVEQPQLFSGSILRNPMPQRSASPKASPSASPTFISSPKISELHELPRPPASPAAKSSRPLGFVGYSGPLMPTGHGLSATNQLVMSRAASPLPQPPQKLNMPCVRTLSISVFSMKVVNKKKWLIKTNCSTDFIPDPQTNKVPLVAKFSCYAEDNDYINGHILLNLRIRF